MLCPEILGFKACIELRYNDINTLLVDGFNNGRKHNNELNLESSTYQAYAGMLW